MAAASGLLAAGGIILSMPPPVNIKFVNQRPMIGAATSLAILDLGLTKGVRTTKTAIVANRSFFPIFK